MNLNIHNIIIKYFIEKLLYIPRIMIRTFKFYSCADNFWKSVPEGSWNTCKSNSGTTAMI